MNRRHAEHTRDPRHYSWVAGRAVVAGLLCTGMLLSGCGPPRYDGSLLKKAAALGTKHEWDKARPFIKAHLLKYPEDPVGHYYYGESYLHLKFPQLTIAEGELLTTQALLAKSPKLPPGAINMPFNVFEGKMHQMTALVYMRAFREALQRNVPYAASRELLVKAAAQVDLGLKCNPRSNILKQYSDFLTKTLQGTPENMPKIMTKAAGQGGSV